MQWDIHMQCGRHICSGPYVINVKLYIPVLVVTLLIALSSYEAYILTQLFHMCTLTNLLYVAYLWNFMDIFVVDTCMVIAWKIKVAIGIFFKIFFLFQIF